MKTLNIDGSSKEVQGLIKMLGDHYVAELNTILLGFYHQLAHDNLSLDDLDRVGKQYGLELEKDYMDMFMTMVNDDV